MRENEIDAILEEANITDEGERRIYARGLRLFASDLVLRAYLPDAIATILRRDFPRYFDPLYIGRYRDAYRRRYGL
jgi:hypothetical protein